MEAAARGLGATAPGDDAPDRAAELTVAEIMKVADVSRQTVFTYRGKVVSGRVAGLLARGKAPGNRPVVRGAVQTEFLARFAEGKFRRAKDALAWIKKRTCQTLSESSARKVLRGLGGHPEGAAQEPC